MSATISQPFGKQTWTPVFSSAKTAGNGGTQLFHTGSKVPSASNVMVPTDLNTIENSVGVARQMPRSTCLGLKSRRVNHALTLSNALTARAIIKLIQISVHFGGTDLTENSTWTNTPRSMKTGQNQFVLKGMALLSNDHSKPQDLFSKCL